jgi:hypothetical protein
MNVSRAVAQCSSGTRGNPRRDHGGVVSDAKMCRQHMAAMLLEPAGGDHRAARPSLDLALAARDEANCSPVLASRKIFRLELWDE